MHACDASTAESRPGDHVLSIPKLCRVGHMRETLSQKEIPVSCFLAQNAAYLDYTICT